MLTQSVWKYCDCPEPSRVTIYDGESTLYCIAPTVLAMFCDKCKREIKADDEC